MIPKGLPEIEEELGGLESHDYDIEVNAVAFSATVDTLYEDKVTSPKREYMTNAADAHIEAGHTKDFQVTLPTVLDPIFKVRDFGPGLAYALLIITFTRLFGSLKGNTNKQTGYLGLGSKSMYAYTTTATVRSFQNGVVDTYLCSRASGVPKVTHISSGPTDEPDGLEVSYAVRAEDITRFHKAASWLLFGFKGYPVQPKFNMEVHPSWRDGTRVQDDSLVYKTDQVEIYSSTGYYPEVFIRQGPVMYPIKDAPTWLNPYFNAVITVPIGTVGVATSRETLSMDDETSLIIKNIFDETREHIKKSIEDGLASSASWAEACKAYFGNFSFLKAVATPSYGGKQLATYLESEFIDGMTIAESPRHAQRKKLDFVYVNGLSKMVFYYHLAGVDVPRTTKRWELIPSDGRSKYRYLRNATEASLAQLKADCFFEDSQFIDIASIADPGVAPRPKKNSSLNASTTLKPYVIERTRWDWVQADVPTNGEYFWLPCDRKGGKITFRDTGKWGESTGATWFMNVVSPWLEALRSDLVEPFPDYPVLMMPKRVQDKYDPPDDMRLDTYLDAFVTKQAEVMRQAFLVRNLNDNFVKAMGLEVTGAKRVSQRNWGRCFPTLLQRVDLLNGINKKNDKITTEYAAKYPLIFQSGTVDMYKDYIEVMNKNKRKRTKV